MKTSLMLMAKKSDALRQGLKKQRLIRGLEIIDLPFQEKPLRQFQTNKPDLVLIGVENGESNQELHAAQQIREFDPRVPIIFVAQRSSEALAIAALKAGANDFFKSPFTFEDLAQSINKNLPNHTAALPSQPKKLSCDTAIVSSIIGNSSAMLAIKTQIGRVAQSDSTVLITGETGTGKELAARAIHCNSPRYAQPLVCINCAAIPDSLVESELFGYERGAFTGAHATKQGLFETAADGTVFLDEIGDMTPFAQAKILRIIEMKQANRLGGKDGKRLDFRVVAATNCDPEKLLDERHFRKDLYYRLNVARIQLPPLRERKEDIPLLIDHFITQYNQHFGRSIQNYTDEALETLLTYDWPGNVRELKNLVEVSFINLPSRQTSLIDIPDQLKTKIEVLKSLPQNERERLIAALCATNWNKSKAAQKLNWSRMTLYRKLAKYNIARNPTLPSHK